MRRALAWSLILPFAGASILLGHGAAYTLTGVPAGTLHDYLAHVPQIVAVLLALGLLGLAYDARVRSLPVARVAMLAAAGFVAQEHLERFVHTGTAPFLLTSSTFWIGLALQLPFAALVWFLARRVAVALVTTRRRRPPRLALVASCLAPEPSLARVAVPAGAISCRGPPVRL